MCLNLYHDSWHVMLYSNAYVLAMTNTRYCLHVCNFLRQSAQGACFECLCTLPWWVHFIAFVCTRSCHCMHRMQPSCAHGAARLGVIRCLTNLSTIVWLIKLWLQKIGLFWRFSWLFCRLGKIFIIKARVWSWKSFLPYVSILIEL